MHDILTIALYQRDELARMADEVHALQMAVGALGLALVVVVAALIYIL